MKFVMTQSICPEGIEKLKADTNGQVEIIAEDNPDPNNYLDDMKDADALIVRIAKCDAHAIENSPNLKVIGRTGVGYDSVDGDPAYTVVQVATNDLIILVAFIPIVKFLLGVSNVTVPFPLVKDIVGYLKMCHSILPIKR